MKTGASDDEKEVDGSSHQLNGNGQQCYKHVGLLKVGKDSHPLYVSGRRQNNGSRKVVVCDILWGMKPLPIDCLSQFLTARRRGVAVELQVVATAAITLGEEFSRVSPESLRRDLLDLSSKGHDAAIVVLLQPGFTVASSPLNAAYA